MISYLLQANTINSIPIAVLGVFFSVITLVLIWMFRPGSEELYKEIASQAIDQGVRKNEK